MYSIHGVTHGPFLCSSTSMYVHLDHKPSVINLPVPGTLWNLGKPTSGAFFFLLFRHWKQSMNSVSVERVSSNCAFKSGTSAANRYERLRRIQTAFSVYFSFARAVSVVAPWTVSNKTGIKPNQYIWNILNIFQIYLIYLKYI